MPLQGEYEPSPTSWVLQQEGKIGHIGLSEVTVHQIREARKIPDIVSVQNLYNLANRQAEDVLDYAERENLGQRHIAPLTASLRREDAAETRRSNSLPRWSDQPTI